MEIPNVVKSTIINKLLGKNSLEVKNKAGATKKTIARRARNTKNFHVPKGTSVAEYAKSTALEAVLGYYHINGNENRKEEILEKIISLIEQNN